MKTLIVYYSRTNTTKKVAEELAKRLNADLEQLIDTKNREGVMGYIVSGRDALKKNLTTIEKTRYSPADYDLVIVGTPIWVGTFTPAIRTYLEAEKNRINNIAFFATQGAIPPKQEVAFTYLEELSAKKSKANLHLSTKQVANSNISAEVDLFIKTILT